MEERKSDHTAEPESPDDDEEVIIISPDDARKLQEVSAEWDIPFDVLVHESIALGLREFGVSLPSELVEYLNATGRPIPPGAKCDPKKHGLN